MNDRTNMLRWIRRKVKGKDEFGNPCTVGHEMVLQQWHSGWGFEVINGVNGEWVDIPIENEA